MLRVGIEHEFVFADDRGRYLDADNAGYELFRDIVSDFPVFAGDDDWLECKSLESFPKRCYVEGLERHDAAGRVVETLPKGLEIRTLPRLSVSAVVAEFRASWAEAMRLARRAGLAPLLTSRHPFKRELDIGRRLGEQERAVRTAERLALALRSMLSHGVHVNVSIEGHGAERMADLARKVNYYTPALIPWSFSSPFSEGRAFDGLCCRNYHRAETRRLAGVVERQGVPVLEFRGFDACGDATLLEDLLRLYCGFLLDERLPARSDAQDPDRIRLSAVHGFRQASIRAEALAVLEAAQAVQGDAGGAFGRLRGRLEANDSYAARMRRRHAEGADIMACISGLYDY